MMEMKKTETEYDVIVVGAGLAGAMAAYEAATEGVSTLMVEKHPKIGIPVRCAEGISARVNEFLDIEKECPWCVSQKIKGAALVSPNGTEVFLWRKGYVLNKPLFNDFLVRAAKDEGAEVLLNAEAVGLGMKEDVNHLEVRESNKERVFSGKVIIGAGGIKSSIAKMAGLRREKIKLGDIAVCYQELLQQPKSENSDTAYLFFGNEFAPHGYGWRFPKGNGFMNVGIGISGQEIKDTKIPVSQYYSRFYGKIFPTGAEIEIFRKEHAQISVGLPIESRTANRIIIAGEEAGFVDSLTGGGNYFAMKTGGIAGKVAAESVINNDTSRNGLSAFEDETRETADIVKNLYNARQVIQGLTDEELDNIAEIMQGAELSETSPVGIMGELVEHIKTKQFDLYLKIFSGLMQRSIST
jgi:digeranylgeranylglycerophospholipid reductase